MDPSRWLVLDAILDAMSLANLKLLYSKLKVKTPGGRPGPKQNLIAAIKAVPTEGREHSRTAIRQNGRNLRITGHDNVIKQQLINLNLLQLVYVILPHSEEEWLVNIQQVIHQNNLTSITAAELLALRSITSASSNSAGRSSDDSNSAGPSSDGSNSAGRSSDGSKSAGPRSSADATSDITTIATQTDDIEGYSIDVCKQFEKIEKCSAEIETLFSVEIKLITLLRIRHLLNQSYDDVDVANALISLNGKSLNFALTFSKIENTLQLLKEKMMKVEASVRESFHVTVLKLENVPQNYLSLLDASDLADVREVLEEQIAYTELFGPVPDKLLSCQAQNQT